MRANNERGYSLPEGAVVIAIAMLLAALGVPTLRAYSVEAQLLGAGREFKSRFLKARSTAVRLSVETAIRFEPQTDAVYYSIYIDGNFNGVLSAEIESGIDKRIEGPFLLTSGAPDVRVGINPGVPAIPPDTGELDPSDPIRFGPSDILSFSPLGTATPGTFYIATRWMQGAVRVSPGSARVALLTCRNRMWSER
jgi:type II secretory pathway pseudopilin PulG